MVRFSKSDKLATPNNRIFTAKKFYQFGKASTYNFNEVSHSTLLEAIPDLLYSNTSPYLYEKGLRSANTMQGVGNLCILDIDGKEDTQKKLFECVKSFNFQYVVLPTQNHLMIVEGVTYYKYRLIIPVLNIQTVKHYKSFIHYIVKALNIPDVDSASWTDARFYAPTIPPKGYTFTDIGKITDEVINQFYNRLGFVVNEQGIQIPEHLYPRNLDAGWLQYEPHMEQYAPIEEDIVTGSIVRGDEFTQVFDGSENTIDEASLESIKAYGENISFGAIIANMVNNSRVFCKCPTADLHTNPDDIRYAWLLKTGKGDARLYCASDHCKQQFGEFRRIVLPEWTKFIDDPNYHKTITRLKQIVEQVKLNLLTELALFVCSWKQVELEHHHERVAYAQPILFGEIIDDNALHILTLLISKEKQGKAYLYDLDLDGCVRGKLDVKSANLLSRGGWFTYLFNEGYADFASTIQDKAVYKTNIFKSIVDTVSSDLQFTELKTQTDTIKPSELLNGKILVDYSHIGREVKLITNSFDTPLLRRQAYLERRGVLDDMQRYNDTIEAFINHWKLPYGSVIFNGMAINDLPTLLIVFNSLNMFTDGSTNQRHSSIVITAPAGIGKTSLIKNFAEAGLSNGDNYSADIFGYDGLYPQTIDEVKNKLWVTGDELSPNLMKSIRTSTLLANLTRLEVSVNVKGLVNSRFTAFGKVLWGARAWDAISLGSQATELRSRLYAITYLDEHFNKSKFLDMCEVDTGYIDNIIQHRLITIYRYVKELILQYSFNDRILMLNAMKSDMKTRYAGTIAYDVDISDEGEIVEVVQQRVKSDDERVVATYLEAMLQYRNRVISTPVAGEGSLVFTYLDANDGLRLDTQARRIQFCEEVMIRADKAGLEPILVLPSVRDFNERCVTAPLKHSGMSEKQIQWIVHSLKRRLLTKLADTEELLPNCANRDKRTVTLYNPATAETINIHTNKKNLTYLVFRVSKIEGFLEGLS